MNDKTNKLTSLVGILMKMACIIDRHGENGDSQFADEIGMGYLALSSYLRDGVKAIVDMQMEYSEAIANKQIAELSEQYARNYLKEIFGDEDIDSINERYKLKIKEFVQSLFNE